MSRGFVKEGDQEEVPLVPPRAHLPEGVKNYVTPNGFTELLAERQRLVGERDNLDIAGENERRIEVNHIHARLHLLDNRIAEAQVVDLREQPHDEVRFGAWVTLSIEAAKTIQVFQIVGVDEADVARGKISFISPLANVLVNKKVGDKAVLKIGKQERVFEILNISYTEISRAGSPQ